jgi:uncharacterized protein (DUF1810 family)
VKNSDTYDLQRFVDAQDPVYDRVLSELRTGRKRSHWMWFVFPQIAGLGYSSTAARFAIRSIEEAKAYLNHPVLGIRLRKCSQLVNEIAGKTVDDIFGYPDDLKFRSSMTLFAIAGGDQVFNQALQKYFNGEYDSRTVDLLRVSGSKD